MRNLSKDLSALSTMQENDIEKLIYLSKLIISHNIYEDIILHNKVSEIDIGIGKLLIQLNKNEIEYKFIPHKDTEKTIVTTITKEKDFLASTIENKIYTKIKKAYKDLL